MDTHEVLSKMRTLGHQYAIANAIGAMGHMKIFA